MSHFFIAGIGTDVGKTVVAAIVTEALQADYWKPVQSGLDETDKATVKSLVSNNRTVFHPEAYRLKTPMSPHKSAEIDGIEIELSEIIKPKTSNLLVVEGAGGILVPLNDKNTIIDLIDQDDKVVLVSSGYLGSINHTLLTAQALKAAGKNCVGVIYNHIELDGTIEIIEKMTGLPTIGIIKRHDHITPEIITNYAIQFKEKLLNL